MTTSAKGAPTPLRLELTRDGVNRLCHQTNETSISKSPSQAKPFFIAPPRPVRFRNIVRSGSFGELRCRLACDSGSRSGYCVPVPPPPLQNFRGVYLDSGELRRAPAI